MFKKIHFIFLLISSTISYSGEVDTIKRTNLISQIAKQLEKKWESVGCTVSEDLKNGTVVFQEDIVSAFNFDKSWTNFDNYSHLYAKKKALKNLKDNGKMFETKDLKKEDEYAVVGCKLKVSFDSSLFYVLKNKRNNQEILISSYDIEEIAKTVRNEYYQFYDLLQNLEYGKIDSELKVIKWSVVQRKSLEILVKNGDEKTLDLFLKHKVEIPPRFLADVNYSPLIKYYSKLIHIVPKGSRWMYFYDAFLADVPVDVLKLYNDVKKNDIDQDNWPRIVAIACESNKDTLEKLKLLESIGFDFKEIGGENQNALHHLSQFGSHNLERCTDFLLSKGIKINSLDKNGDTPLHRASSVGNEKLSLYLLSKGADPTIKNIKGKVPKV